MPRQPMPCLSRSLARELRRPRRLLLRGFQRAAGSSHFQRKFGCCRKLKRGRPCHPPQSLRLPGRPRRPSWQTKTLGWASGTATTAALCHRATAKEARPHRDEGLLIGMIVWRVSIVGSRRRVAMRHGMSMLTYCVLLLTLSSSLYFALPSCSCERLPRLEGRLC